MDESELYSEVVKTLRNVKSAEQLDWANPCANEVSEYMFYFAPLLASATNCIT